MSTKNDILKAEREVGYAESLFPPTHRIAGFRMRPLTMGHVLLLTALENGWMPWLSPMKREGASVGDIAELILVCTNDWRKSARIVQGPLAKWRIKYIGLAISGCGFVRSTAAALRYLAFWLNEKPEFMRNESKGFQESEAPTLCWLVSRFLHCGCNRSEILDSTFRELAWESICMAEITGAGRVSSDAELVSAVTQQILSRKKLDMSWLTKPTR